MLYLHLSFVCAVQRYNLSGLACAQWMGEFTDWSSLLLISISIKVFVISLKLQSISISRSVYKGRDCVTSVFAALSPCDHKKCPNQLYLSMMHSSLLAEPSKTWYKLLSAEQRNENQQKVWICLPCTPGRLRSSDLSKVSSFLLTRISTNQGILTDIQS